MKKKLLFLLLSICFIYCLKCDVNATTVSCNTTYVSGSQDTLSDITWSKNVYVPKSAELTLSGSITITGNIYVFGTLNNKSNLTVNGTIYALHYGTMMSAGDYAYGYFNNSSKVNATNLVIKDTFLSTVTIPSVTHNYVTTITKEATCIESGIKTIKCSNCEQSSIETIPASGHKYGAWLIAQPATCTSTGTQTRTCSVCKDTQTQTIPAMGVHTYSVWNITQPASVFAEGSRTGTCSVCGNTETQSIPKLTPTIKLSKTKVTLKRKKTTTIKVSNLANGDSVKLWKSIKKKVAVVNSKGKIKAKKKGKTNIIVTLASGKSAVVKVTVK